MSFFSFRSWLIKGAFFSPSIVSVQAWQPGLLMNNKGVGEIQSFGTDTVFLCQLQAGLRTYLFCFVEYGRGYHGFQYGNVVFFIAHWRVRVVQIFIREVGEVS